MRPTRRRAPVQPKKRATGRVMGCNKCGLRFRGEGVTRVMRKLVFIFCAGCWKNRDACEMFMVRASGPQPIRTDVAA